MRNFKRLMVAILILTLSVFLFGCASGNKNKKEKTFLSDVSAGTTDENNVYDSMSGKTLSYLEKRWGKPVYSEESRAIWQVESTILDVSFGDGKVIYASKAIKRELYVADVLNDTQIFVVDIDAFNANKNADTLATISTQTVLGETVDVQAGDAIVIWYSGLSEELYPVHHRDVYTYGLLDNGLTEEDTEVLQKTLLDWMADDEM